MTWSSADNPPSAAARTTAAVLHARAPILFVSHEILDGVWLVLDDGADGGELLPVALAEVLARDPALAELLDLPPGWEARRAGPAAPWRRYPRCC